MGQILAARDDSGEARAPVYSDAGAHLLSAVLVEATGVPVCRCAGVPVLKYARENLFDPLGIPTEPAFEPTWDIAHEAATEATYEQYWEADFTWGARS